MAEYDRLLGDVEQLSVKDVRTISALNAGQALSLEVFAHTQLELAVHQEPHVVRGENSFALLLALAMTTCLTPSTSAGFTRAHI